MFNLYSGDSFGLNYSEMDNNTFTLTLAEVEGSIVQSYSEVFGSLDQLRISQMLLFEGCSELLPTVMREHLGAAKLLHKPAAAAKHHANTMSSAAAATTESENSEANKYTIYTQMKHVFQHVPAALHLDRSLLMAHRPVPAAASASAAHKYSPTLSTIVSVSVTDSTSAKDAISANSRGTTPKNGFAEENTPVVPEITVNAHSAKSKALSYSLRYELFHFANQVLFKLAQAVVEVCPSVALDVYQMCILILAHLQHNQDRVRIEKIVTMLAVKVSYVVLVLLCCGDVEVVVVIV